MKALILGSCKGGAHINHRHKNNRLACRTKDNKKMPAAVLAHTPKADVILDWERDTDLFRIYANIETSEGTDIPDIREIHLLDDALQTAGVINPSTFNENEWDSIYTAVMDEWDRMNA